ncbi:MAG: metal ABC transporter permease [Victivallales bacterium]|nr:metal ABC transporter permease [Victivallales bacterium]
MLAIVLASIACGIVGGYVVAQRQSYMIGAISHSLLGGVGLARYLQVVHGLLFITPIAGASIAAAIASMLITVLTMKTKARSDAVLSAVWTMGVALGVSFISMTPGYAEDLNSYLFGSVLLVSKSDLVFMTILDLLIVVVSFAFHNRFLAYCFRAETLELRGLSATATALMLNLLIAFTVVLLSQVVGIVLVLVLLVLPAAIAACYAVHLRNIMLGGGLICLCVSMIGIFISYEHDLPTGATIIELIVALFLMVSIINAIRKVFSSKKNNLAQ